MTHIKHRLLVLLISIMSVGAHAAPTVDFTTTVAVGTKECEKPAPLPAEWSKGLSPRVLPVPKGSADVTLCGGAGTFIEVRSGRGVLITPPAALPQMLARTARAHGLLKVVDVVKAAGNGDLVTIERSVAGKALAATDVPELAGDTKVNLRIKSKGLQMVDVTLFAIDARKQVTALWPPAGASGRLDLGKSAAIDIVTDELAPGLETVVVVALPVAEGTFGAANKNLADLAQHKPTPMKDRGELADLVAHALDIDAPAKAKGLKETGPQMETLSWTVKKKAT